MLNAENGYRTQSLHLRQIVYGNTMLQFDTNANGDASVNEALVFYRVSRFSVLNSFMLHTV